MFKRTTARVKDLASRMLMLDDTPHSIALGAAVGIFLSFTPLIGVHMGLVVALSLVIRMNRTVGLAAVWVNNPLTVIPVYFFNYLIGAAVLFWEPITWSVFRDTVRSALTYGTWYQNLGAMCLALGRIAIEFALPLWVGSLIVATALAVPTYFIVRRLAEKYQARSRGPAYVEPPEEETVD